MQSQMDARIASMKSPGIKSGLPSSPTTRAFNPNRQSAVVDTILTPDPSLVPHGQDSAAAATLAHQRAKFKASNANAAHRISAPVLATTGPDGRTSWGPSALSQVSEQQPSVENEVIVNVSRPKSSDFSGSLGTPKLGGAGDGAGESWASMVTTPLVPMFKKEPRPTSTALDSAPKNDWVSSAPPGVPRMGDPTIHRRNKNQHQPAATGTDHSSAVVYDDNGNPIQTGQSRPPGLRNPSGPHNINNTGGWSGTRSPALGGQSNRFDGNDPTMNGLGMQMAGFGLGMGSPTLGMGMPGLGMQPMSPFNMNMLGMMSPEAQLLAAQMAAGGFGQPNMFGMQPLSAGLGPGGRRGPGSARSPGPKSATSTTSRHDGNSTPKGEDDVDPALLTDIPAWLRSLRLHKYTPNFEGCKWQDMVLMDEAALEAKGVAALGARRKMLKTFETVRAKMGIEGGPPPSAAPSATGKE